MWNTFAADVGCERSEGDLEQAIQGDVRPRRNGLCSVSLARWSVVRTLAAALLTWKASRRRRESRPADALSRNFPELRFPDVLCENASKKFVEWQSSLIGLLAKLVFQNRIHPKAESCWCHARIVLAHFCKSIAKKIAKLRLTFPPSELESLHATRGGSRWTPQGATDAAHSHQTRSPETGSACTSSRGCDTPQSQVQACTSQAQAESEAGYTSIL